jgi:hypothetical protein
MKLLERLHRSAFLLGVLGLLITVVPAHAKPNCPPGSDTPACGPVNGKFIFLTLSGGSVYQAESVNMTLSEKTGAATSPKKWAVKALDGRPARNRVSAGVYLRQATEGCGQRLSADASRHVHGRNLGGQSQRICTAESVAINASNCRPEGLHRAAANRHSRFPADPLAVFLRFVSSVA